MEDDPREKTVRIRWDEEAARRSKDIYEQKNRSTLSLMDVV